MSKFLIPPKLAVFCFLSVLTLTTPSKAGLITSVSSDVQDLGNGFKYSYTVTNLASSDLPIAAFSLNVSADAGLTSIIAPLGFANIYSAGDSFIEFDSGDSSTDIPIGASGVFSFESTLGPTSQDYLVVGFNDFGFDINAGTTVGPGIASSAIPEPTSLTLLALGSLSLLGYGWRRRKAVA
jgi:PEP-CTERM motif